MKKTVYGILVVEKIVETFAVDQNLRNHKGTPRKHRTRDAFDGKSNSEMKWRKWHSSLSCELSASLADAQRGSDADDRHSHDSAQTG